MPSLPTPGGSDVWGADLNAAIESLHLGPDTHANRPTTGLVAGTLYSCTDHALIYRWDGAGWVTYGDLGGAESYEDAVAALPGKVHRWRWDEASGATVADAVGSLALALSGTYTRAVTTPFGTGTTFGTSSKAVPSSGTNNLPTGSTPRTFIFLCQNTKLGESPLLVYGSGGTRQWNSLSVGQSDAASGKYAIWSDDLSAANTAAVDQGWHLVAFGYDGTQTLYFYVDGQVVTHRTAVPIATTPNTNLTIGDGLLGTIDDLVVCSQWVGKAYLDRLRAALGA